MPEKEKSIPDAIQEILDVNRGFVAMSKLPSLMSGDLRGKLGLKRNIPVKILIKKLEPVLGDRFILRKKGNTQYILTLCDLAEFVTALLSPRKGITPKMLANRLPFTQGDVRQIVNELVDSGQAKVKLSEKLDPQIYSVEDKPIVRSVDSGGDGGKVHVTGGHTRAEFREAYDELHREREFVRICDLRRRLGWPREEFDEMLRGLRDSMTVHMAQAEERYFSKDELADCWVDENNYRMGTIRWNGR